MFNQLGLDGVLELDLTLSRNTLIFLLVSSRQLIDLHSFGLRELIIDGQICFCGGQQEYHFTWGLLGTVAQRASIVITIENRLMYL